MPDDIDELILARVVQLVELLANPDTLKAAIAAFEDAREAHQSTKDEAAAALAALADRESDLTAREAAMEELEAREAAVAEREQNVAARETKIREAFGVGEIAA